MNWENFSFLDVGKSKINYNIIKINIMKRLKQFFCRHKWECIFVYRISADYVCTKCYKTKKDFAPLRIDKSQVNKRKNLTRL